MPKYVPAAARSLFAGGRCQLTIDYAASGMYGIC